MDYFFSQTETIEILEKAKREYQVAHDKFHQNIVDLLEIKAYKDSFYDFMKKIILLDIQSRPMLLTKYDVYRVYDAIEKNFSGINIKREFGSNAPEIVEFLYSKLTNINKMLRSLFIRSFA